MRNPLPFLLAALLIPPTPTMAALSINTTSLQPWQIPRLSTHTPSGYPANHPYWSLSFAVADPNTIVVGQTRFGAAAFPPTTANCSVRWLGYAGAGEDPRGHTYACGSGDADAADTGRWTFRVANDSASAISDFALRVGLEEAVVLETGAVDEDAPVLVQQRLVEVQCVEGTCEEDEDGDAGA
ncbi:uncharacterized protein THITE_2052408 [Thermothielavioides terrestris NRRL 8126]|uniref:Ubiquitin 3 binding protein But2 C-terminal domain-containing protein n=1 Tax=Thermothielavioides terrestris (strain ATCC 38088 / NRRL 8126) TaxID=578455 RepID=G2RAI6_THETT|nr:uncharacterized protein THITE_2052408 [Thermothielavioides terrestris NRRL 8126]AEO69721.1 hypothetical protein THITE_2052408 [Thermothielavioides terrestris NRRL 8126]